MQIVFINEQHYLLPGQVELLEDVYETRLVPKDGWTYEEQLVVANQALNDLRESEDDEDSVVFVSPVPALLKLLAHASGKFGGFDCLVFHNDRRDKKELPDGRIISVVAKDGWELV